MDAPVPDLRPDSLGERGSALWTALMAGRGQDAARAVLAGEAARLADRLDGLDRLLSGKHDGLAQLSPRKSDGAVVLVVDSAASEARQAATALRQLIYQLTAESGTKPAGGTLADELAARRAGRDTGT